MCRRYYSQSQLEGCDAVIFVTASKMDLYLELHRAYEARLCRSRSIHIKDIKKTLTQRGKRSKWVASKEASRRNQSKEKGNLSSLS